MVQKFNGNKKNYKGKFIRCRYCNEKLYEDELIKGEYITKIANCKIVLCPYCDKEFQE